MKEEIPVFTLWYGVVGTLLERELEPKLPELPLGEPQQEYAVEPQHEPRFPPGPATPCPGLAVRPLPARRAPRTPPPRRDGQIRIPGRRAKPWGRPGGRRTDAARGGVAAGQDRGDRGEIPRAVVARRDGALLDLCGRESSRGVRGGPQPRDPARRRPRSPPPIRHMRHILLPHGFTSHLDPAQKHLCAGSRAS
jgi:hypothetical protein